MARQGLERYVDAKVLCNATNHSIVLTGILPEGVAIKKGRDL